MNSTDFQKSLKRRKSKNSQVKNPLPFNPIIKLKLKTNFSAVDFSRFYKVFKRVEMWYSIVFLFLSNSKNELKFMQNQTQFHLNATKWIVKRN